MDNNVAPMNDFDAQRDKYATLDCYLAFEWRNRGGIDDDDDDEQEDTGRLGRFMRIFGYLLLLRSTGFQDHRRCDLHW